MEQNCAFKTTVFVPNSICWFSRKDSRTSSFVATTSYRALRRLQLANNALSPFKNSRNCSEAWKCCEASDLQSTTSGAASELSQSTTTRDEKIRQPIIGVQALNGAMSPYMRKALTAFASVGVLETTYLSFYKIFSSPGAICGTQGCLDVLTGPYSAIFGIPLSLFGMIGYGAFAYLASWPLFSKEEEHFLDVDKGTTAVFSANEVYAKRDAITRPLMLALSSILLVFSSYLMGLLGLVIRSMCPYCVFSAVLTLVLFVMTALVGNAVPNVKNAFKIVGTSAAMALLGAVCMFFLSTPRGINAQPPSEPQAPPAITQQSTKTSMRIAKKLAEHDTKMYGAYWCTHCFDQKQRFGRRAFERIKYIECDKYGKNTQYKLCRQKRIPGYPTWEIDGEQYPGEISLEDLEKLADDKS